jgi:hypothetical protein
MHDFQSYLKVVGIRKLTGGDSVRGEILTKGKCRVLGTEPNFRRLLGENTEIFDAAVGKRMSCKYFLIRRIDGTKENHRDQGIHCRFGFWQTIIQWRDQFSKRTREMKQ